MSARLLAVEVQKGRRLVEDAKRGHHHHQSSNDDDYDAILSSSPQNNVLHDDHFFRVALTLENAFANASHLSYDAVKRSSQRSSPVDVDAVAKEKAARERERLLQLLLRQCDWALVSCIFCVSTRCWTNSLTRGPGPQ